MKIAVVGTRGFPFIQGGIETHCQGLYPELVKLGCEVVVFRRKPYINESNNFEVYENVKFIDLWAPRSKSGEAIVHSFISIIYARFLAVDIVHIHGIGPGLLVPFAKIIGLKVVFTTQGPDYNRQKWGGFAKHMLRLGEKWGSKNADAVIVVSRVIKEITERKYKRYDTQLIYSGVNFPVKNSGVDYIESLGLKKGKYIVAVARFVKEKGFDYLVESYLMLNEPEYKLVLVGDADHRTTYSSNLKKLAIKKGVVATGIIQGEQLNQIYTNARLFVLPSFHEGLSLALLEALSFGLDVLVSDIPANTLFCLGESCYFKVGDVNDLAKKLFSKLNSAEEHVPFDLTNYKWTTIASQTLAVYNNVASQNVK